MNQITVSKIASLSGHNDCVYTLESANNSHFFSGAGDGMIALWDIKNPENGHLIAKLPNSIYALHRMGNKLVAGHNYDGIHTIDWQEKYELSSLKVTESAIFDIKSIKDIILVASGDGEITAIDGISNVIIKKIRNSQQSARCLAVHPYISQFAVGYSDHNVRVFDGNNFEMIHELKAHDNSVFTVQYSPDGTRLISSGRDAHLKIWNTNKWKVENDTVAHMYAINHVTFNEDGTKYATCSMDKSIKLWDAYTNQLLKVIDKSRHAGHGTSVNKLLWKSETLCSASDDRSIALWDIQFG